jgi:hypothetical protein
MCRPATCIVGLVAVLLNASVALCDVTETDAAYAGGAKNGTRVPASARLSRLDEDQRANARLSLEPLNGLATANRVGAAAVEDQWRLGSYKAAISALEQLEAAGAIFAPCVSWIEPIASDQPDYYQDVRIGGTRVDAEDVAIDYDRVTGNIFVAVSWSAAVEHTWTLNISTDGGANWAETFTFGEPSLIDMAVIGDYVYVAYSPTSTANEARMRRFLAFNGAEDTTYSVPQPYYHTVADVSPKTIVDIIAGANADNFNNRIYCGFIDSAHNIGFYWDEHLDGETFTDDSPTGVSAATGLDFHWNTNSMVEAYQWLSYLGTDNAIHTAAIEDYVWHNDIVEESYTGSPLRPRTRISAYGDKVFVVYSHQYTDGRGVRYQVSYNAGATWNGGSLYTPDASEPGADMPDISVRSGAGSAAVYNREDGSFDNAYYVTRPGYHSGAWKDPLTYNDYDVISGTENYIQWIGSGACVYSYAMVYFAEGGIPYFDLMTPRGFFCDGFESGGLVNWN